MAVPQPVAGLSHDLVLAAGEPGNETLQGLMVKGGLQHYNCQPFTPFAPAAREGEATNRDLALPAVWELQQDFSGGVGKFVERKTEDNGYALSFANCGPSAYPPTKTGTTLYTGMAGCIMPPAALRDAGTNNNVKQFIEFKSGETTRYYFLDSAVTPNTPDVWVYDPNGNTPSRVKNGAGAGLGACSAKQIYTDGSTLFVTRGASLAVMKTTNGDDWVPHSFNADFVCMRDDGALACIAGATLTPGTGVAGSPIYQATTVGASGTTATGMVFFKGALWIGKPEGLFSWYQAKVDKRFDAMEHQNGANFTKMCVHHDLLYFNVKNQLYYTDGDRYVQIFPNDAGGFADLSCLFPTSGPLLIGGKLLTFAAGQSPAYYAQTSSDDASIGTVAWTGTETNNVGDSDNVYAEANLIRVPAGPNTPSSIQNAGTPGTVQWTDPDKAAASDDDYATVTLTADQASDDLQIRRLNFAIPSDATIIGIAVRIEGNMTGATSPTYIEGWIVKGGERYGGCGYALPASAMEDSEWTVGGDQTLWETTWTPSDINADTFGADLRVRGDAGRTYNLDCVKLTVYYLPVSHYLKCTNFAVSLPTNAVPVGVQVNIETEWGYSGSFAAKLVKGGVIGGAEAPALPVTYLGGMPAAGTEKHQVIGGMYTLWGNNLTRDDVTANDFGVAIRAWGINGTVRLDAVKLCVFYTIMDTSLEQLYMFWGPDAPGLNPLWSDGDGTHPVLAIGATSLFDPTGERIYFCCNDTFYTNKTHYLSMTPRYVPATFSTDNAHTSFIELTEFSAGFRTVAKWWYQIELNVRDPVATTFAKVEYCVDGGPWLSVEDEQGNPARLVLDHRVVGAYFPRDLIGVYISLRVHMYASSFRSAAESVAKITHITLRGLTVPKVRYQFSFPANCDHTVPTLTPIADSGETVRDLIRNAAGQGYPCRLQDPWGKWHLVKFREPSPMDVITDAEKPQNNARQRLYAAVQCVLVEVDELDAHGDLPEWSLG